MNKIRLLLVEDDPDHQRLILRALQHDHSSLDIRVVGDPDEFLGAIAEEAFSCIVMDYNLGPHTAVELLTMTDRRLDNTPVVVISSSESQQVVINSIRRGVSDYVPKRDAVQPGTLWMSIEAAIAKLQRTTRERRRAERRIQELRREAEQDPLTGLWNRRYTSRSLDRREMLRSCVGYSIVMLDIDHFKRINDRYGHDVGDHVIKAIARKLQDSAVDGDIVARWGGEEFLVVKRAEDESGSWTWANQVRREVALASVAVGDQLIPVTVSMGVACGLCSDDANTLIRRADQALYLGKELGRNRVCTTRMVDIYSIASSVGDEADLSPSERLSEFMRRVDRMLGTVQRDHLGPHSQLVRAIALSIGQVMGATEEQVERLALGAVAHDIGKTGVPESLLAKAGTLTTDEKLFIDEHARLGAQIAARLGFPRDVVEIIRSHHVRYDAIAEHHLQDQTACSIVSVADAFAAMAQDRPYAPRRPLSLILAEFQHERGKQFDPDVVTAAQTIDHERVPSESLLYAA